MTGDSRHRAVTRTAASVLLAACLGVLPAFGPARAATSSDALWADADAARIAALGTRALLPTSPRTVTLDLPALRSALAKAPPARSSKTGVTISLPMPDGSFARFSAFDSPVMEPGLATQFPEIRTWLVQGLDDATLSGRIGVTAAGLRGIVLGARQTVYIDPYRRGVTDTYVTYTRRDYYAEAGAMSFECGVAGSADAGPLHRTGGGIDRLANGDQLRSYRIAVAGTTEFTADQGGAAAALASVVDTVMRLNAIFERELAVHFDLVANNANIIYAGADPYTNGNPSALNSQNQANLDDPATIGGSAAYDIGHVIGTWPGGGSGLASLDSVCNNALKARGSSSSSTPAGDPFVVDLMAHEIGHQFDANHTFNGTTGSCGGGNRNGSTAWEPGSGSTIMAYAGICGAENLQLSHDDYFHVGSIEEMLAWIGANPTGSSCGTLTATGNQPPVPDAGAAFTIPVDTPFTLAGSATDGNGDPLTYTWEQFDLGAASPPNTDDGSRPLFRSSRKTLDPTRTFPVLGDILTGNSSLGEALPTTDRTLNFRFAARDNRAGGGGIDWDEVTLTSTTSAGPFRVTSLNDGGGVASGAATLITWDVANTDAAPVDCSAVDIDLSTDGGATFPTSLAAATANDGSEAVTMPALQSTQARVRVACSDNVFFDINDSDFGVGASLSTTCDTPGIFLGEATSTSDTLTIADGDTILDLNVSIDASMATFASTAGFSLSKGATNVTLVTSNPNCFGNDIDIVFDDEASVEIADVCGGTPAIGGIARPEGSLGNFDGLDSTGSWTLNYSNFFTGCGPAPCTGTLNEWCLTTAVAVVAAPDTDGDGVADTEDNCLLVQNATQVDSNGDNIGNACDADLNGDCGVNFGDLALLKQDFLTTNNPDADFNSDGSVNFGDLAFMKSTFFNGANPGPGPSGLPNACD